MDYRVFSADIIFDDNSIGKEEEEEKETLSLYGFVFRGSGKSPISPLSQASNAKKEKKKISSRIFEISPFENSGASLRYELDVYTAAVSPFDLGATPKQ